MRLLIFVLAGLALTTVVTQAKEAAELNLLAPADCAKFTRMPDGTIHVGENVTISGVTYKGADQCAVARQQNKRWSIPTMW